MKPVEMQIALPRTMDAGSVQQQQNQKPVIDQTLAGELAAKMAENLRKKPDKLEQTSQAAIRNNPQSGGRNGPGRNKPESGQRKQARDQGKEEPAHPYKGRHIDLSL